MSPIVIRNDEGRFISCPNDSTEEGLAEFNDALRRNTFNKLRDNESLASTVKGLKFKPDKDAKNSA